MGELSRWQIAQYLIEVRRLLLLVGRALPPSMAQHSASLMDCYTGIKESSQHIDEEFEALEE